MKFFQTFFSTSREILGDNFKSILIECLTSKDENDGRNVFHSTFDGSNDAIHEEKLKVLKTNKNILFDILGKKEVVELLMAKDKSGKTPMIIAAQSSNVTIFETFFDVFINFLNHEILLRLLSQKSNENLTTLQYLILNKRQNIDIFDFDSFKRIFGLNFKSTIVNLLNSDQNETFFHFIFSNSRVKFTEKLLKVCKSAIDECETAEDIRKLLTLQDLRGNTCMTLAATDSEKLKQFFVLFKKYLYQQMVREIIKIRNSNQLTPLHCVVLRQDLKSMKMSFEMFNKILTDEGFRGLVYATFVTDAGHDDINQLILNSSCDDKYKKIEILKIYLDDRRYLRENSLENERSFSSLPSPRSPVIITVDEKDKNDIGRPSLSPTFPSLSLYDRRSPSNYLESITRKSITSRSSRSPQNDRNSSDDNEFFRNYLSPKFDHDHRNYKMKFNGSGM